MKIKEVEERVGLTRSNIRFYEREGLLLIDRDQENNYRDYTEADVERINKIKNLRMLGVPTADIRKLFANEIEFDQVITECMERIKEQERELKEIHKACENMMQKQLNIHTWDGQIEADGKGVWKARLDEIFSQDLIYTPVSRKKMNFNITIMLLVGYAINIIFSSVLWPLFLKYQGYAGEGLPSNGGGYAFIGDRSVHWNYTYLAIIACLVTVLICKALIFYTDNPKIQIATFIINSLCVSPLLLVLIQWYEDVLIIYNHLNILTLQVFTLADIWLFWILIMFYVVIIYMISIKREKVFIKKRYILCLAGIFTIVYTFIYYLKSSCFWGPLLGIGIMLVFISFSWLRVNIEQEKYSRYDIYTTANFIINPLGTFIQF